MTLRVNSLRDASWPEINALRDGIMRPAASVEEAASRFAVLLADNLASIVLSRLFVVLPYWRLPAEDRAFARRIVAESTEPAADTPVLTLLGTAGREPSWRDRRRSKDHRALPLVSEHFVAGIPMLGALLSDLEVSFSGLSEGHPLTSRRMQGGRNATFFVPDAVTSLDSQGRLIIPSGDFVARYGVRSVFGMGGAYVDDTLAVAIVFTNESLTPLDVARYPSFISNFKMATSGLLAKGTIFAEDGS